MSMHRVAVT